MLNKRASVFLQSTDYPRWLRNVDILLSVAAFSQWFLVWCYKIQLRSLINLLQPCHLLLPLQAVSLMCTGSMGPMLAMMSLPMVAGSFSAILFPATEGLDMPFEETSFWTQHVFIQLIPFYLLCRHNFLCAKNINMNMILFGNWLLIFTHWSLFEVSCKLSWPFLSFLFCSLVNTSH